VKIHLIFLVWISATINIGGRWVGQIIGKLLCFLNGLFFPHYGADFFDYVWRYLLQTVDFFRVFGNEPQCFLFSLSAHNAFAIESNIAANYYFRHFTILLWKTPSAVGSWIVSKGGWWRLSTSLYTIFFVGAILFGCFFVFYPVQIFYPTVAVV